MARGADLVSHEATFDRNMLDKAKIAQHSTAGMAGAFGRQIGARNLFLTHFSSRYSGGVAPVSRFAKFDRKPPASTVRPPPPPSPMTPLLPSPKEACLWHCTSG